MSAQRRRDEDQVVAERNDEHEAGMTTPPRPIPPALQKLPIHLRDAAIRSWLAREEDYRYLADR